MSTAAVLRSSKAVYISAWLNRRAGREEIVPKLLRARAPQNIVEERKIRKLAGSRHAPGDWILRARITVDERSRIIALVSKDPPGKLLTEPGGGLQTEDETKAAYWTLDALAKAANEIGIEVGRSQVRRILLAEGVRWRQTRAWAESPEPEFVLKD